MKPSERINARASELQEAVPYPSRNDALRTAILEYLDGHAGGATVSERERVRPVVAWFAEQMETVLRANDHKGGWITCDIGYLKSRLREECVELEMALDADTNERAIREAVDVANFAMMIADSLTDEKRPNNWGNVTDGDSVPQSATGDGTGEDEHSMKSHRELMAFSELQRELARAFKNIPDLHYTAVSYAVDKLIDAKLEAHAGGATVSESPFCAFEDCDTTVEHAGDCCPKHLEPDESCRRGVHVWYYGEGHETIGICKWCGAYESAISKSETTQPATGDGTGEDEGDDSCPRDGLGHHTWSRRCNDCGEVRADRSEKLDRALRAALSDIEHLGQEKTALKEKLAAAYGDHIEAETRAEKAEAALDETREQFGVECAGRQAAEQRAEKAEARVAAWEPTIVAAIEQAETSFFFEGARIRHCSEKFWPAVKAIPAEHRPEVKP